MTGTKTLEPATTFVLATSSLGLSSAKFNGCGTEHGDEPRSCWCHVKKVTQGSIAVAAQCHSTRQDFLIQGEKAGTDVASLGMLLEALMNTTTENKVELSAKELAVIELRFQLNIESSPDAFVEATNMSDAERSETEASALRKLRNLSLENLPLLRKEAI